MILVSITLCSFCQWWCIVLSAPWPVSLLLSSSIYLLQQLLSKLINLSVFLSQTAGRRPLSGHHLCGNVQQHADTHSHTKCNTLLRWPYVVHLTNKPTHWASHAGITCPFPGTISLFPCYWFNWHAKLTLTLFLSIPFPSAYCSPLKQLSLLIFVSPSSPLSLNLSYFQGRSERAGERVIYSVYMKGALDHFINLWLR